MFVPFYYQNESTNLGTSNKLHILHKRNVMLVWYAWTGTQQGLAAHALGGTAAQPCKLWLRHLPSLASLARCARSKILLDVTMKTLGLRAS